MKSTKKKHNILNDLTFSKSILGITLTKAFTQKKKKAVYKSK